MLGKLEETLAGVCECARILHAGEGDGSVRPVGELSTTELEVTGLSGVTKGNLVVRSQSIVRLITDFMAYNEVHFNFRVTKPLLSTAHIIYTV